MKIAPRAVVLLVVAVLALACLVPGAPALAQGWKGGWTPQRPMSPEERRGLREDVDRARRDPGMQRPDRSPEEIQQRRDERSRLREAVQEGRMSREEAVDQYRGRFGGPYGGRRELSREERDRIRRDVIDANRDRGRR
jgi:hypothetical protein